MNRFAKMHIVPKLNIAAYCAALAFVGAIVVGVF